VRRRFISPDAEERAVAGYEISLTRRGFVAGAAGVMLAGPAAAAPETWTRQAYMEAMARSGRPVDLTEAQFQAVQSRKPAAMKRIASYLKEHLGSADPVVMAGIRGGAAGIFHYLYDSHRATRRCLRAEPKPWGLGYGSALSDYLGRPT